jgi:hypothetical protein
LVLGYILDFYSKYDIVSNKDDKGIYAPSRLFLWSNFNNRGPKRVI